LVCPPSTTGVGMDQTPPLARKERWL